MTERAREMFQSMGTARCFVVRGARRDIFKKNRGVQLTQGLIERVLWLGYSQNCDEEVKLSWQVTGDMGTPSLTMTDQNHTWGT